jgi:predicted nucleic acid-binding protein
MPMILVDTSVWIVYFRASDRHLTAHLQALLEEDRVSLAVPVKIEILCGSAARDRARLRRVLEALPLLIPSSSTWERMEGWIEKAVSKGERFGVADLLIAALAADRGMLLWSLDSDFGRMQKLGFVRLHTPS